MQSIKLFSRRCHKVGEISCRCLHESLHDNNNNDSDRYLRISNQSYETDHMTNVGPNILNKVDRKLHLLTNHPLQIIKSKIIEHFHSNYRSRFGGCLFASVDNLNPVVSIKQNFDNLLVPADHISRSKNDNYYVNSNYVLRSHTTAHEVELIRSGWNAFLNFGDCYRRDEIDRTHYPVFHQMEGVRVFNENELFADINDTALSILERQPTNRTPDKQELLTLDATRLVEFQLKHALTALTEYLFEDGVEMRWVDTYFPFTHPSWELEVKINGEWVEMLGCGILEQKIMQSAGAGNQIGWAFGLGLERFAMKLYDIPDIRLFWSEDSRFLQQFKDGHVNKFKPFSKYPPSFKDISFWVENDGDFSVNDLFEIVRSVADDVIEEMNLVDQFKNPKTNKTSLCYRITYRAMDRTLTDGEVNTMQDEIREQVEKLLNVTLR